MSILTRPGSSGQHRARRAVGHDRAVRLRAAIRTAHAPVGRGLAALMGYAAGLLTAAAALGLTTWIGG